MPSVAASIFVLAALALAVGLALCSIWKDHKTGKSCSCGGDCSHCKGCH